MNLSISRKSEEVKEAMNAYLDGFYEAVKEFYIQNQLATLQKITFPILDKDLEKLFKEKLKEFKKENPETAKKITPDKAGPRFNITKYYTQGAQKLGMTIAPHKNHEFLGGVLDKGNVLEEQISGLSDISIGNSQFNSNVKAEFSIQSPEIAKPRVPAPLTEVDIRRSYKEADYVKNKEIFYHKNGHNEGKRITYTETKFINEGQRMAGAYCQTTEKTHEVLNEILQSVIDAAKSTDINDKEKLKEILINATKKGTVKGDTSVDPNVKKFSALFQKNCKNKNIFSAQDYKTGLRTKRFGDVFGGIDGIKNAIDIHITVKDSKLSLNNITEQTSALQASTYQAKA